MKHAYRPDCPCPRCTKERERRDAQSLRSLPARAGRIRRTMRETPTERYARLVYEDIIREP
jgi:hypothetical protein